MKVSKILLSSFILGAFVSSDARSQMPPEYKGPPVVDYREKPEGAIVVFPDGKLSAPLNEERPSIPPFRPALPPKEKILRPFIPDIPIKPLNIPRDLKVLQQKCTTDSCPRDSAKKPGQKLPESGMRTMEVKPGDIMKRYPGMKYGQKQCITYPCN